MLVVTRLLRAALVAAILLPAAAPAFAGPAETALLEKYVGTWKGKGQLTGAEAGTVLCRLTLKLTGQKVAFNGRCASSGSPASSFSGTMTYNDAKKRYESTSSASKTVIGKKSGGGVLFATEQSSQRGTVTSTLSLTGGMIKVEFQMIDARTKEVTRGRIPFARS